MQAEGTFVCLCRETENRISVYDGKRYPTSTAEYIHSGSCIRVFFDVILLKSDALRP